MSDNTDDTARDERHRARMARKKALMDERIRAASESPSGHTWLTLTVLHLAARRAPGLALGLAVPATGLILATVTLRFHYLVDIFAGALLYYPALRLALWLDREGGAWAPRPT